VAALPPAGAGQAPLKEGAAIFLEVATASSRCSMRRSSWTRCAPSCSRATRICTARSAEDGPDGEALAPQAADSAR